jgi:integrase
MALIEKFGPVTIRERGNRFRITWFEDGRQRERSAITYDEAARIAMNEAARMLPDGVKKPARGIRYKMLVAAYLQSAHTLNWGQGHRIHVAGLARNHVIPVLGDELCSDMTPERVSVLLLAMSEDGYKKATIEHVLKLLRQVSAEGVRRGIWRLGMEPTSGVRVPATAAGKVSGLRPVLSTDIPTDAQVDALSVALDSIDTRYGLLVRLAATSGMRLGELLALRASDIDLAGRIIHVRQQVTERHGKRVWSSPKTDAGVRDVPLAASLVAPLTGLCASAGSGPLFATKNGYPFARSHWTKVFRRGANIAGWPAAWHMHTLRHYAISRWRRLGIPDADCTKFAGHANVAITLRLYAGADSTALDRAKQLL